MKKVYQTKLGKDGNCLVACIASFLDKEINEIPFTICKENTWKKSLKEYLISEGYEYEEIYNNQEQVYFNNLIYANNPEYDLNYNIDFYNELKKNKSSEKFLKRFEEESKNPTSFNGYLIVSGVSPRDPTILHAVIYKDGKLFHDPNPNGGCVKNIISYKIIRKIKNQELYKKLIAKIKSNLIIKKYNIEQFKKEIDEFFQIIIEDKGTFIKDEKIIKKSETLTELENNIYKTKFDKEIEILKKLHNEIEHKSFSKTILKEIEEIYSKIEKQFENLKKEVKELHDLTKEIFKESHLHDHTFITKIENLKKEINEEEHILNKMINDLEEIYKLFNKIENEIIENKTNDTNFKENDSIVDNNFNFKIGVKMSTELRDFLKGSFSPYFERAFLIFEKEGVVQKAIESTTPNSPRSFSFESEHIMDVVNIMAREGYGYVGTYHHHLDSDEEIQFKKNPQPNYSAYKLGPNYNPDQLSPDDIGGFNCIGFNFGEMDTEPVKAIMAKVKYMFLGHQSKKIPFHIKGYTVLNDRVTRKLPQDHPLNKLKENPHLKKFIIDHYRGFDDILSHPIEFIKINDNDPSGEKILKKHNPRFKILEYNTDKKRRFFTKDDLITMAEFYDKNEVKRYIFEKGHLKIIMIYKDNTTRKGSANLKRIEDNLKEEENKFYEIYNNLIKSN